MGEAETAPTSLEAEGMGHGMGHTTMKAQPNLAVKVVRKGQASRGWD